MARPKKTKIELETKQDVKVVDFKPIGSNCTSAVFITNENLDNIKSLQLITDQPIDSHAVGKYLVMFADNSCKLYPKQTFETYWFFTYDAGDREKE